MQNFLEFASFVSDLEELMSDGFTFVNNWSHSDKGQIDLKRAIRDLKEPIEALYMLFLAPDEEILLTEEGKLYLQFRGCEAMTDIVSELNDNEEDPLEATEAILFMFNHLFPEISFLFGEDEIDYIEHMFYIVFANTKEYREAVIVPLYPILKMEEGI